MRESPTFILMDKLAARGAEVAYYDLHIPEIGPTREHAQWQGTRSIDWNEQTLRTFAAAIIVTAHKAVDYAALAKWCDCIVDTRLAFSPAGRFGTLKPGPFPSDNQHASMVNL